MKERAEINAEAEAFAYSTLYGKWINESENVCIVFDYDNQYIKHFSVYKLIDEEWQEYETMNIRKLDE